MPKFRKKPVIIEAEQYVEGKALPAGVEMSCAGTFPFIHTLEGPMRVSDGDWIITGVNGEKYPCKPDIFKKTYEPVNE